MTGDAEFMRLCYIVLFAAAGFAAFWLGPRLGTARMIIRVKRAEFSVERARIERVLETRDRLERNKPNTWLPFALIGVTMAVATALTRIPLAAANALFWLSLVVILAVMQFASGRTVTRRAAPLRARNPLAPWWVIACGAGVAMSPFLYWDEEPVAASLVLVASAASLAIGAAIWRADAFAAGDDPVVEEYVDALIRRSRFQLALQAAMLPAYLFAVQHILDHTRTHLVQSIMLGFVMFAAAAVNLWLAARSQTDVTSDRTGIWWQSATG